MADHQHGLDGAATLRVGDGTVDLGEGVKLYQAVEGETPRLVELDQFRNELLGHRVALNDAEDLAVSRQMAWRARSAEQRRFTTWIQQFSRELLHAAIRRALHHTINASARYGPDAPGEISLPIVDGVGRAQFAGEFETAIVEVHRDDRFGFDDARGHHRGQANRAGTKNSNG